MPNNIQVFFCRKYLSYWSFVCGCWIHWSPC